MARTVKHKTYFETLERRTEENVRNIDALRRENVHLADEVARLRLMVIKVVASGAPI